MKEINFTVSKEDGELIDKIVKKAKNIDKQVDALSLSMDLRACHANSTPLHLDKLLASDILDFSHDINGIIKHLDRTTGKLTDCFQPRFAR